MIAAIYADTVDPRGQRGREPRQSGGRVQSVLTKTSVRHKVSA